MRSAAFLSSALLEAGPHQSENALARLSALIKRGAFRFVTMKPAYWETNPTRPGAKATERAPSLHRGRSTSRSIGHCKAAGALKPTDTPQDQRIMCIA